MQPILTTVGRSPHPTGASQRRHPQVLTLLALSVLALIGFATPGATGAQSAAAPEVAEAPRPPADVLAEDRPWDGGTAAIVSWAPSPDDPGTVTGYLVQHAVVPRDVQRRLAVETALDPTDFDELTWDEELMAPSAADAGIPIGERISLTIGSLTSGRPYVFRVVALAEGGASSAPAYRPTPFIAKVNWFDSNRFYLLIILAIFGGSVVYFIYHARSGGELKIRKIAGLAAVDEAVGRATEMGRSALFIPGIQDVNDIQTIAGLNVLSFVAKTAAEYDARVEVPTARSLVMTTARETVQAAYLGAGRPDAYNPDNIYYVTDEQFGYVAYLQGHMAREKPAACFYMGAFFAESLILAETGNSIGAIQVAGTAMPAQLPFFVAACDYTLIGEEFFAASAYLSGEPDQLGSLKGQDVGKVIVAIGIVIGVLIFTLGVLLDSELLLSIVNYLKNVVLT